MQGKHVLGRAGSGSDNAPDHVGLNAGASMANIVLAHGILGFGSSPFHLGVNYFNGVERELQRLGHTVIVPSVAPLGSLEHRSKQLATAIASYCPGNSDLFVIAHSMGGLDARKVICEIPAVGNRIRKLISIATPHFGSPVADAVLDSTHALHKSIPAWLMSALSQNAGALQDLRTRKKMHNEDRPGVEYMEVVCTANSSGLGSPFFGLTTAIGNLSGPNDGVVTHASACCPGREPIQYWPVDHGEAIGWPSGLFGIQAMSALFWPPKDHIDRYKKLARLLQ